MSLVFLHYWGGSSRTWRHVIAALPKSYRTIAIDHRGWGGSDAPATGYALSDLADDARGVVDVLNSEAIHAHRAFHGRQSRSADGVAPPGRPDRPYPGRSFAAAALGPPRRGERGDGGCIFDARQSWHGHRSDADSQGPQHGRPRAGHRGQPARCAAGKGGAWPRSTSFEDITRDVAAINAPTIVVAGELDRVDSIDLLKAELLSRIPHAALHVLRGTGHLSPLELPLELARVIGDFVDAQAKVH